MTRVIEIPEQRKMVRGITDHNRYYDFISTVFYEGRRSPLELYDRRYRDNLPTPPKRYSPEYYQLLAFTDTMFAWLGFGRLSGRILRHERHEWTKSPFTPAHVLEQASHAGVLARAILPVKDVWEKQLLDMGEKETALGVWAIDEVKFKGGVLKIPAWSPARLLSEANYALDYESPILRADRTLARELSQLGFTGDQADNLPEDFKETILPKAAELLKDVVDLKAVFEQHIVQG